MTDSASVSVICKFLTAANRRGSFSPFCVLNGMIIKTASIRQGDRSWFVRLMNLKSRGVPYVSLLKKDIDKVESKGASILGRWTPIGRYRIKVPDL
jgi:hypothetical protein